MFYLDWLLLFFVLIVASYYLTVAAPNFNHSITHFPILFPLIYQSRWTIDTSPNKIYAPSTFHHRRRRRRGCCSRQCRRHPPYHYCRRLSEIRMGRHMLHVWKESLEGKRLDMQTSWTSRLSRRERESVDKLWAHQSASKYNERTALNPSLFFDSCKILQCAEMINGDSFDGIILMEGYLMVQKDGKCVRYKIPPHTRMYPLPLINVYQWFSLFTFLCKRDLVKRKIKFS